MSCCPEVRVPISNLDDLAAGMLPGRILQKNSATGQGAGSLHSSFYLAGQPGAAVAPTPGLNGAALTSYSGQLDVPTAVSGKQIYLAGLDAVSNGVGAMFLYDRLWHNSGIVMTTTTAQAITHPGLPSRDIAASSNGEGVSVALEVSTVTGNAGTITNTTISYTNESGTAGRTGTLQSFPAAAVAGYWTPFALQAGDRGVRSIQSITLGTSYVSGTMHLVQYRQIGLIAQPSDNVGRSMAWDELKLPKVWDSSVPFLVYMLSSATIGRAFGAASYAQY